MPLEPSTRLGPYEIVAMIGAGGMGEVYRARHPSGLHEIYVRAFPDNGPLTSNYDLAPDDKRFAVLMPADNPEPRETQNHIKLVVNFFDEIRRRVMAQSK